MTSYKARPLKRFKWTFKAIKREPLTIVVLATNKASAEALVRQQAALNGMNPDWVNPDKIRSEVI